MLELIIGCMFGGKSTELIRRIRLARSLQHRVFIVNFHGDTRYGDDASSVRTHDGDSEACTVAASRLLPLLDDPRLREARFVVVDEAHFFPDLVQFVLECCNQHGKSMCVAGLDADSWAVPFESVVALIPFAEEVVRLKGLCRMCGDGTPATLTVRLPAPQESDTRRLMVGGQATYMPVCRRHFFLGKGA